MYSSGQCKMQEEICGLQCNVCLFCRQTLHSTSLYPKYRYKYAGCSVCSYCEQALYSTYLYQDLIEVEN